MTNLSTELAPKRIWLLDYGTPECTWCDDPSPSGEDHSPVEYVRADAALKAAETHSTPSTPDRGSYPAIRAGNALADRVEETSATETPPGDYAGLVEKLSAYANGNPQTLWRSKTELEAADAITALTRQLATLRHENDCLQATIAQIDYPCSPHCHGYLREQKLLRDNEALTRQLGALQKGLT